MGHRQVIRIAGRRWSFAYDLPHMILRTQASLALLLMVGSAGAIEHPGIVPQGVECRSCHANKLTGKSVHSAMETTCTVCHVERTQGDMMSVSLSMPKEKICSACHDESAALRQHVPAVKGSCVECHDAHSSDRKDLLRDVAAI